MTDIQIRFEPPKVCINGQTFDVLKSDAEIMEDMLALDERLSALRSPARAMQEKRSMLLAYLDQLLGEGAADALTACMEELTGGRGMGGASAARVCEEVIAAAGRAYARAFKISYGDEP